MNNFFTGLFLFISAAVSTAQSTVSFADSLRIKYNIPELAYAVVTADSVIELQALGVQRVNTNFKAGVDDKFRIGSNTKTVTAYIAAVLVKQGKVKWETRFFDLYPELKTKSQAAFYDVSLQDLITFRVPLISWTYTNDTPTINEIKGNEQEQRCKFMSWVLQQNPDTVKKTYYWANPAYVAAGLMLEKASGKDYKTLVAELGKEVGIEFGFGQPNCKDEKQPWGHNADLVPEKPKQDYKLNWLCAAGNIHVSLPDYIKFIQLQLRGLAGKSNWFSAEEFNYMHYGLPGFSFGWQVHTDEVNRLRYAYHKGNPGSFLSKVYICKSTGKAFVLFANVQSEEAEKGLTVLFDELSKRYSK